ncbi:MAG: 50S ribosomal protein L15 [Balneola sp.]
MDLHNLKAPAPNNKNRKRVGRGEGSGHGEQSGRGHNGQKSRSGFKRRPWFEGGQMPLQRRIPKFGFKNPNRKETRPLNVQTIGEFVEAGKLGATITIADLVAAGLAHKNDFIKLLGRGEISTKVEVEVHAASKSAVELIEKAGGKVNVI